MSVPMWVPTSVTLTPVPAAKSEKTSEESVHSVEVRREYETRGLPNAPPCPTTSCVWRSLPLPYLTLYDPGLPAYPYGTREGAVNILWKRVLRRFFHARRVCCVLLITYNISRMCGAERRRAPSRPGWRLLPGHRPPPDRQPPPDGETTTLAQGSKMLS